MLDARASEGDDLTMCMLKRQKTKQRKKRGEKKQTAREGFGEEQPVTDSQARALGQTIAGPKVSIQ